MRTALILLFAVAAFAQSPGASPFAIGGSVGGGLVPPATITQSATGATPLTGVTLDGSTVPFWQFNNNNVNFNFASAGGGVLRFGTTALANSPPTSGTIIAGNLPSTFTGHCLDFQRNNVGAIRVHCDTATPQVNISDFRITNTSYSSNFLVATGANGGRISTYNSEATGQGATNLTMGVPYFRAGAQVASASNTALTTIITPVASAMYRVAFYCFVSTTDAARTATVVLNWSDPNGNAQTVNACNGVSTAVAGTFVAGQQIIATNTTAVQYSITYTGGATGVLTLKYTMERLQ